jgi:SPP1 gp7 family putative phage head morphogenesis protein
MPDQFLFGPVPHQEAIDFIKSKPVVSRQVFDGLLPELRGRAFAIAGLEGHANVAQAIRDRIADLPAGHDWNEAKKDIVNDLSPFLVDPHADPDEHDAQVAAANRRAELLLRTHGFQAYQAAEYQVMDRQRDVFPFWQYHSMEDSAVRPTHAALDKLVLPANSPFWNTHFPPWDWGCRCQAIPITQDDRDDIAKEDKKRPPDARLVCEGPVLTHLEQGTLVRNARTYDVRPPIEKEGGSGFSWDPSTLKLPLEQLEQRYDPEVWAEWKAWAQATPMGPNHPTVWDWLSSGSATKPVAPTPAPTIVTTKHPTPQPPPLPAPPRPTLDQFIAQHTALPGKMTEAEATVVIAALKQSHGISVADKVSKVVVARTLPPQWKTFAPAVVQDFLNVMPKPVLDALPKFTLQVRSKMSANTLGEYDPNKQILSLNAWLLAAKGEAQIRRTLFHELAHWVHLEGLKSKAPALVDYAAAIKSHFDARTVGESIAYLPGYGNAKGKKDKFWDAYMGRIYPGIIDGCEIPTRVFELLTDSSKLSLYWNIDLHRETIKKSLAVLFP